VDQQYDRRQKKNRKKIKDKVAVEEEQEELEQAVAQWREAAVEEVMDHGW
jgi:hypothetical protein